MVLYLLAGAAAVAFLSALVFGPKWIEELTGLEPDGGDGSLEALLVVIPAVVAVGLWASGFAVRRHVARAESG
jgi:hypothetical protein